ncbi:hypothetical protein ERJ75_000525200 [Trypanosoma vivax]|nr:hypothetical protein ERJ75_001702900 [Trypanosoma vivax]KAH8615989.1 hypothetical protein ERJ75_000525200 [Trypanosoma vivax]
MGRPASRLLHDARTGGRDHKLEWPSSRAAGQAVSHILPLHNESEQARAAAGNRYAGERLTFPAIDRHAGRPEDGVFPPPEHRPRLALHVRASPPRIDTRSRGATARLHADTSGDALTRTRTPPALSQRRTKAAPHRQTAGLTGLWRGGTRRSDAGRGGGGKQHAPEVGRFPRARDISAAARSCWTVRRKGRVESRGDAERRRAPSDI